MKQPCGCCAGIEIVTPEPEANRPGLPALVYRAGTYATFLETMLARLSTLYLDVPAGGTGAQQRIYPLSQLTTRDPGDPSIALLDAWATVADVLTFYQERIANEGYLRTALERRSILELARLVGYKLRSGVSASVYLAFTVADGFQGTLPAGTRSQSIPGSGQKPQFFETSDDLPARDVWNNLKPRLTRPQVITLNSDPGTDAATRQTLYLQGTSTNLNPGDALLFVLGEGSGQQVLRKVQAVNVQADQKRTEVTLEESRRLLSGETWAAVKAALDPFIDEASSIFADSDLAAQVSQVLLELRENIQSYLQSAFQSGKTVVQGTVPAQMVASLIPQVQDWHDVAVRRKFTRLEPWLANLLDILNMLVQQLPGTRQASASFFSDVPPVSVGQIASVVSTEAQLPASPLEDIAGILDSLSLSPSLQPANSFRLGRTVTQAFSRQSDIAPRMLATFHPAAAPALYGAWAGIERPVAQVQVFAMRVKASPFGSNAALKVTVAGGVPSYHDWSLVESNNVEGPPSIQHESNGVIYLDSNYDKISPRSWMVVDTSAVDTTSTRVIAVPAPGVLYARTGDLKSSVTRADYGMSGKTTRIPLLDPGLNPVNWLIMSNALLPDPTTGNSPDFVAIRNTVVYAQPEELPLAEEPLDTDVEGDTLELAQLYDGLDSGRWIIVSGERTDIPHTTGVPASELVMVSAVVQGTRAPLCAMFPSGFVPFSQYFYTTDANKSGDRLVVGLLSSLAALKERFPKPPTLSNQQFCDQVQLAPGVYASAYVPTPDELQGKFPDFAGLLVDPRTNLPYPDGNILDASGHNPVLNAAGEPIASPPGSEPLVFAWRISTQPVHSILTLANKLAYTYDSTTVTIYGNVVKATNGQTQGEVLGDGDSSKSLQQFALHQSPLTYLSAPTPSGAQSTLTVRVNEVAWKEADNLLLSGARDRNYIKQTDDNDQTKVTFGTGQHGARVPTGTANVKAVYRSGTGKDGNVDALQISQLATQPLGAKGVINPLRASGGADRDSRDQARRNAPLAVMALDRLVSVRDYADFARTFAGIGKAASARLSDGRKLTVHVTIAGKDDIPIDQNSDLYRNLVLALEQSGDPHQPIQVALRRLKLLVISARIKVQLDYAFDAVAPNLRAALLAFYSFENRDLGQSAFMSEAIGVMQAVQGVEYVDLHIFDFVPEGVTAKQLAGLAASLTLRQVVKSELAAIDPAATDPAKRILPAELVFLTPAIQDTLLLTEITA